VVGVRIPGGEAAHRRLRYFSRPFQDSILLALAFENVAAEPVHDLALLVHHVVVFEEVLADLEVARLHALLGGADGPRDQLVLDRLAFLHAEPLHDALDALGPEDAEEGVLEGEGEARGARIALGARAAAELGVESGGGGAPRAPGRPRARAGSPRAPPPRGFAAPRGGGARGRAPPVSGPLGQGSGDCPQGGCGARPPPCSWRW